MDKSERKYLALLLVAGKIYRKMQQKEGYISISRISYLFLLFCLFSLHGAIIELFRMIEGLSFPLDTQLGLTAAFGMMHLGFFMLYAYIAIQAYLVRRGVKYGDN